MNDGMGSYVAHEVVKLMIQKDCKVKGGNVLVLGITFKENCPDIRNSKVIDVINELERYNLRVTIHDPWANANEVQHEFGKVLVNDVSDLENNYDAIILAVAHKAFKDMDVKGLSAPNSVIFDVKAFLDSAIIDGRL